jgi:predicted Zn-dependent protease with MMP-like domain
MKYEKHMNERIQELAEQARASVPPGLVVEEWIQVYNIKLGQLIVQECTSVVENLSPGYKDYRDQIEDAFRRDCVAEIKHHFGVEE